MVAQQLSGFLMREFKVQSEHQEIFIFLNKAGLIRTMERNWRGDIPTKFEEFIAGFNGFHPMFHFVDAGGRNQAADKKLIGETGCIDYTEYRILTKFAAHLNKEIRLSQTKLIIFGGKLCSVLELGTCRAHRERLKDAMTGATSVPSKLSKTKVLGVNLGSCQHTVVNCRRGIKNSSSS